MTRLMFEKEGDPLTLSGYQLVESMMPTFCAGRPVDMRYDEKTGRIIIDNDNPEEIRSIFLERNYREVTGS